MLAILVWLLLQLSTPSVTACPQVVTGGEQVPCHQTAIEHAPQRAHQP